MTTNLLHGDGATRHLTENVVLSPALLKAIDALLATDTSIPNAERARRLRLVRDGVPPPRVVTPSTVPVRIVKRAEAAQRLGVSTRAVDSLAAAGALKRVHFPGRKRAAGFAESEIVALIAGRSAEGGAA